MSEHSTIPHASPRLPFVDALRALAATLIVWHHFAYYGLVPFRELPPIDERVNLLWELRWAVQVFFVIGGYLMARSLARREHSCAVVGQFLLGRYFRLGLPYLVTLAVALAAAAYGRGWVPDDVIGAPPTLPQVLAHVVFLQDILDYESLSAGLWYVCIDIQLTLIYVAMWYLHAAMAGRFRRSNDRTPTGVPLFLSGLLAVASLYYFNKFESWDPFAVYFFCHFFVGVIVFQALERPGAAYSFALYTIAVVVALIDTWRWPLAVSLATGLALFCAGRVGLLARWPTSRVVAYLGRTSYSMYLTHFPVLVVVLAVWMRQDWISVTGAVTALAVAYIASLAVAAAFYDAVERPANRLSQKVA